MKKFLIVAIVALLAVSCKPTTKVSVNNTQPQQNNNSNVPVAPVTPTTGKIDEHLTIDDTLRDVNFCGTVYKSKQLIIDGVDVVQRIAYLATNNLVPSTVGTTGKQICDYMKYHSKPGQVIETYVSNQFSGKDGTMYNVGIGQLFSVAVPTGQLFIVNDFDGSLAGPIGTLK